METPTDAQIKALIRAADQTQGLNNWHIISAALTKQHAGNPASLIGAAATIAVETAHTFEPINEMGSPQYFMKTYGKRSDWATDGHGLWKWRGRGFIQLTGLYNYSKAASALDIPLLDNPDLACEVGTAADIFCWYWMSHNLPVVCELAAEKNLDAWQEVRYMVNGGSNGMTDFKAALVALGV